MTQPRPTGARARPTGLGRLRALLTPPLLRLAERILARAGFPTNKSGNSASTR